MKVNTRNSWIELLRIFAMFLIISSHYLHEFATIERSFSFNDCFLSIFTSFGQVGVGIFLIISGYFMVTRKFPAKKIVSLYLDVVFYSVTIFIIYFMIDRPYAVQFKMIKRSFLPVLYVNYWFFTAYVIMMLLSPFFNKLINALSKKEYKRLLVVSLSIFSISRFVINSLVAPDSGLIGKLIPCFLFYFIGGYVRLHCVNLDLSYSCSENIIKNIVFGQSMRCFMRAIIATFVYIIYIILIKYIRFYFGISKLNYLEGYFRETNSPFVIYIVYEIFMGVLKLKPFSNRCINIISSSTFGVYLIHEHQLNWKKLFPVLFGSLQAYCKPHFSVKAILSVLAVFVACSVIDLLRQQLFGNLKIKLINILCKYGEHISILGKRFYEITTKYLI